MEGAEGWQAVAASGARGRADARSFPHARTGWRISHGLDLGMAREINRLCALDGPGALVRAERDSSDGRNRGNAQYVGSGDLLGCTEEAVAHHLVERGGRE